MELDIKEHSNLKDAQLQSIYWNPFSSNSLTAITFKLISTIAKEKS